MNPKPKPGKKSVRGTTRRSEVAFLERPDGEETTAGNSAQQQPGVQAPNRPQQPPSVQAPNRPQVIVATPAGGRRPEAATAANWRTSPRVLQDITETTTGRIRNLQTGVDKMNKEMTVVKDLAETLSLLWKGQQELNE